MQLFSARFTFPEHSIGLNMVTILKMWITALFLLPILKGSSATAVDCNLSRFTVCLPNGFKFVFPKSEEEFVKICDETVLNTKCMLNYAETCDDEDTDKLIGRKLLAYLQKLCQVDSPLYKGLVGNLQCMEPIFATEYDECKKTDNQKTMKFFMYLMDLTAKGIKDATDNAKETIKCVDRLYFDACSAAEVGKKCGPEARNAVVDVIQNLDPNLQICNPKIVDDMLNLVKLFEEA